MLWNIDRVRCTSCVPFSCVLSSTITRFCLYRNCWTVGLIPLFCLSQVTIIAANRPPRVLIPVHLVLNPALAEESVSNLNIVFLCYLKQSKNKYTLE